MTPWLRRRHVVHAMRLTTTNADELAAWCGGTTCATGYGRGVIVGDLTVLPDEYLIDDDGAWSRMDAATFLAQFQREGE